MDRMKLSRQKILELFGNLDSSISVSDPDLQDIYNGFVFGDVYYQGQLDVKTRELITIVIMTTNQTLPQLKEHVAVALRTGITPVEIKGAIYQCAPYVGFPKTWNAVQQANEVFKNNNISLPLETQKQANENERYDKGLALQLSLFGDVITNMYQNTPANQKHINTYLSAFCFGDIVSRSGLDIKTRELLTLCILSTLGGCENQLRSHVRANLKAGNDKVTMISAITQSLPYIGFPRMFNAMNCVNEIAPEK